jgi:hypothetical protein
MHPFGRLPQRAAMTVASGDPRAAVRSSSAGWAGSCGNASYPGVWGFPGLGAGTGPAGGAGPVVRGARLGEQVVGAGEQFSGDRGGSDLLPAAVEDRLVGAGELRRPLGGLCGLAEDPAQCGRSESRRVRRRDRPTPLRRA